MKTWPIITEFWENHENLYIYICFWNFEYPMSNNNFSGWKNKKTYVEIFSTMTRKMPKIDQPVSTINLTGSKYKAKMSTQNDSVNSQQGFDNHTWKLK